MAILKNCDIFRRPYNEPGNIMQLSKNINATMTNLFWARFFYKLNYGNALNVIIGKIVLTDSITDIEKNRALLPAHR